MFQGPPVNLSPAFSAGNKLAQGPAFNKEPGVREQSWEQSMHGSFLGEYPSHLGTSARRLHAVLLCRSSLESPLSLLIKPRRD